MLHNSARLNKDFRDNTGGTHIECFLCIILHRECYGCRTHGLNRLIQILVGNDIYIIVFQGDHNKTMNEDVHEKSYASFKWFLIFLERGIYVTYCFMILKRNIKDYLLLKI